MKVTWLDHSALIFENDNIKIAVDLSLSPEELSADEARGILRESPDVVLVTHEHPGHLNLATLAAVLNPDKPVTLLAPINAYRKLKELGTNPNFNYVMLNQHSVWSERGVTFYAVRAEHSDRTAVGFILDDGDKTYYVSGDTLYNYEVIDDVLELVEDGVDYAFLPVNGRHNNMNVKDAADFAYELGAKCAVPVHWKELGESVLTAFDFEDALFLEPFVGEEL